jgi:hypothetical protein
LQKLLKAGDISWQEKGQIEGINMGKKKGCIYEVYLG